MFKLQSPSKYFPADAINTPIETTVFELINFDAF